MSKTPELSLNFRVESPFGNLYRKETVLIVCETPEHTFLLGEKEGFYPKGIVRLIGGGVEESDTSPLAAAQAELEEEISYKPNDDEIKLMGKVTAKAKDKDGNKYKHTAYIYYLKLPDFVQITPKDDLTSVTELTIEGIEQLAKKYVELPKDLMGTEGSLTFRWYDFGQLYGPLHLFTAQLLRTFSLN